ncbi:hypothetical protein J5N97_027847 [Dioscorea zingiberensis]|uniref:NAC domain-containing protein n=1 Tax=Dioscorea zingiberensis TaxID=325984 RepID=A0A9D5BY22_9LILI|nr:hypothetical protein J5N97_027847 [Dioscorea zingiberensis]
MGPAREGKHGRERMGRAPKGEKTNWVMHEYRHQTRFSYRATKEEWVVCRVFKKNSNGKRPTPLLESPTNTNSLSDMGELDVTIYNNLNNFNSFEAGQINENKNKNGNKEMDMNVCLNWFGREALSSSVFPWSSSLLGSNFSSSPTILKPWTNIASLSSFMAQDNATSSKAAECAAQQAYDHQESIWRGGY